MSAPQWKPGDVVDAFVPTRSGRRLLIFMGERGGEWPWRLLGEVDGLEGAGIGATNVRDARLALPSLAGLVVIDPEDRKQVERLMTQWWDNGGFGRRGPEEGVDSMQAALRSLITPPKPDEPQGLGAVVELVGGDVLVRTEGQPDTANWADKYGDFHWWADIDVTRVLSEGWFA